MYLVLDVETTFQIDDRGNFDASPFNSANKLVSVGAKFLGEDPSYFFFHHSQVECPDDTAPLQAMLDKATLLIGHNIKFDLMWLLECGFRYDGPVWDTMVCEYVFLRSQKFSLKLADVAERRGCTSVKRTDLTDSYLKKRIGFEAMPVEVVREYGIADIVTTEELYAIQQSMLEDPRYGSLHPTIRMSNEFLLVLADMEMNGIKIDKDALEEVRKEFEAERVALEKRVNEIARVVMGDRPINLNSSEQLSWVVYSRKVIDKKKWADTFNIGTEMRGATRKPKQRTRMDRKEFYSHVSSQTQILRRQQAEHCTDCNGKGEYYKTKVDGSRWKKPSKCKSCSGAGVVYVDTARVAGLGVAPGDYLDASADGFSTDKTTLERHARAAKEPVAKEFLEAIVRLNAVKSYLTMFVEGIERGLREYTGLLHTNFNQCVAATGRLSSSNPNFQNLPRGTTFPIRKVIMSRFKDGEIMEADFSQLEYRVAVFLGDDEYGRRSIQDNVDRHIFTANTLTEAGQPTSRQDAKPHTFKPLYGGTSGTPAERTYYREFIDIHTGIKEYHRRLQEQAIKYHKITLPTGREYAFPGARRTRTGGSTFATQIKNYPVQGFATADLVPVACIDIHRAFKKAAEEKGLRSLLVLTVHDSVLVDVFPGEREIVAEILLDCMSKVGISLYNRYKVVLDIPIAAEAKAGPNWLAAKDVGSREYLFQAPTAMAS